MNGSRIRGSLPGFRVTEDCGSAIGSLFAIAPCPVARLAVALLAITLLADAPSARAQLIDQFSNPNVAGTGVEPEVTVNSRIRRDYDPLGVRVGSFMLRPDVSVRLGYDDNVLGSANTKGSVLQRTQASLNGASNFSRDSVQLGLTLDDNEYIDQPAQSFTNWAASFGGTLDVGRDTLSAGYAHQNLNLTPRDLDVPLLDHALSYQTDAVHVGYRVEFGRFSVRPDLFVTMYSFEDGNVGGQVYPQKYRDRTVVTPGVIVGYELAPRRTLVGVVRNAVASYRTVEPGSFVRDYNDTSFLTGIDFDSGGLWRYRLLVGYEVRTFSSAAFKTIAAPVAEAGLVFTPTGLTTLTATLSRRIADSSDETTTGVTETALRGTVAHEYLRNILLRAQVEYDVNEYGRGQGSQALYSAGFGVTWLLNRNMRLSATYDFTSRQSSPSSTVGAVLGPSVGSSFSQNFGSGYNESRYLITAGFAL